MIELIIFDLDGVIVDTKKNMELSWEHVKKKYKINKSFIEYKKNVGLPFCDILRKLNINSNQIQIENAYQDASLKNNSKISLFPNVKKTIKELQKNYLTAIVTSKDSKRTKFLIKKFNLTFNYISCPKKNLRGKPYPDQINLVLDRLKIKNRSNVVYIGDTKYDFLTAKKAKINFIHASYGFEKKIADVKVKINKFSDLLKEINVSY